MDKSDIARLLFWFGVFALIALFIVTVMAPSIQNAVPLK